MRSLLPVAVLALLSSVSLAQSRGMPARIAPMRAPMAMRTVPMVRPFVARPMPVRGFRPGVPTRIAPFRPLGRPGSHSGHIGLTFGFGSRHFPFGVSPLNRCFSDAFFDPFFCTRTPTRFSSFAPFSSFVPFASYPFYSMPLYDESSYTSQDTEQLQRANAQVSDLTNQMELLREELEQMREQQSSSRAATAPAPPPDDAKDEPPVSTTLVFRDGHSSQVENYAIVGNTLWVFNDQRRTKIPITELDLRATQQVNEHRGVDFDVPSSVK